MTTNVRDSLTQIINLATALREDLPVEPPPPPPPPDRPTITTQAALTAACKAGGRYRLASGNYIGNWTVTAALDLEGASDGTSALRPLDLLEPVLTVKANDVRLASLSVYNGAPDRETIVVGAFEATSADVQPHRVTLEDLAILAGANGGHRGLSLHGADITVRRCEIQDFFESGRDSQGIWIHNGPGPYLVEDCYIEASGENILLGGAAVNIPGCVPSDVIIRRNRLKKQAWTGAQVKNHYEVKNGRRVRFLDNTIDTWKPSIQQAPIQITPRNQDGQSPWATCEDIEIAGTIFVNVAGGFAVNILGTDDERPSQQIARVQIHHNLFAGSAALLQLLGGVLDYLRVEHNTAPKISTKVFSFDRIGGTGAIRTPLSFVENVVRAGTYGVTGDGSTTIGLPSLTAFCDLVAWTGNLIEAGGAGVTWPAGQTVLPKGSLVTLLDPATFKLLSGTAGY